MAYGLKYSLECTSKLGRHFCAKLFFDGYSGPEISRNLPLSPFKLRKDAAAVIRGTSFEYAIREQVDFEFLEFYANNAKRVKVTFYGPDENIIWMGYNLPQQYQVPYTPPPATVSFTATDGLGLLKYESFTLTGFESQLAILVHCINKIGLEIPFSIAINTFHETHTTDRSPLEQTFEDCLIYLGVNCYEVVEKILNKYDAEITQVRGRWAITCSVDKKSSRMLYDSEGVYVDTEDAPPVLELGYPGAGIDVSPRGYLNMSLQPGGKQINISHNYGRRASLLKNSNFSEFVPPDFPGWTQNGTYTLDQGFTSEGPYALLPGYGSTSGKYIAQQIEVTTDTDDVLYFSYKVGGIGYYLYGGVPKPFARTVRLMVTIFDGTNTAYLQIRDGEPVWVAEESFIEHTVLTKITSPPQMNLSPPFWAPRPPFDGLLEFVLYLSPDDDHYGPDGHFEGLCFSEINCLFMKDGVPYPAGINLHASFDDSSEPGILDDITISAADAPIDVPTANLLYQNITRLSDGTPT